jgi:hypothetical protein
MLTKQWLDWQLTLNALGVHELMGRSAAAGRPQLVQPKPVRAPDRSELRQYCVNFGVPRVRPAEENGAVQVPGLGLKMRDLAANQDTGWFSRSLPSSSDV